jgi:hypothetical protein
MTDSVDADPMVAAIYGLMQSFGNTSVEYKLAALESVYGAIAAAQEVDSRLSGKGEWAAIPGGMMQVRAARNPEFYGESR